MTPLIRRIQKTFPELLFFKIELNPLDSTFTEHIKKLGPDFYKKILPSHLVLNLEYSLLGQQLRSKFLSKNAFNRDAIKRNLVAALMLAELLEHVYQYYLIVPREVVRIREQKSLYRDLLAQINGPLPPVPRLENVSSFSQQVRNSTITINLYRILFSRSKRALDLIALLDRSSETYRNLIKVFDTYTNPIMIHLAWFFYLPRLLVNLFLLLKHTLPGKWMGNEELSLGWSVRFYAQLQRRWFELGNDLAWVAVGFINCFFLTGALAPIAVYLSLACFALDVIMAAVRVCIELNRLYELRKQYVAMQNESTGDALQEITEYLEVINNQIYFEKFRLGSNMTTTSAVFLAMCATAPVFACNPVILLIGALFLITISITNFVLVRMINTQRPRDTIEMTSAASALGFFAKKKEPTEEDLAPNELLVKGCCTSEFRRAEGNK